jgi:predicted MPP superfamily phosphohydrolase
MKRFLILAIFFIVVFSASVLNVHAEELDSPEIKCKDAIMNRVGYVTLDSESDGSCIYYTTDGSEPIKGAEGTKVYKKPIKINKTTVIKCRTYKDDEYSDVETEKIIVLNPVKINCIKLSNGGVQLKWATNKDSNGYLIYRKSKTSKKWKLIKRIHKPEKNSYLDKDITWNNEYSYYIITYIGKHKSLYRDMYESISTKHEHVYEEIKRNEPTCTKNGKSYLQCKMCLAKKQKTIKRLGHNRQPVKEGYYTVEKCTNCGKIYSKYLSKDIPKYWESEVTDSLDKVKAHGNLPGYLFFTDIHWGSNTRKSPAILKYVAEVTSPSFIGCGGDVITYNHPSKKNAFIEIDHFYKTLNYKVFSTVGNHDWNYMANKDTSTYLNNSEIYTHMYQNERNFAVVDQNSLVSYTDDNKNKVRYISFSYDDTTKVSDVTINQLEKNIKSLGSDWSVVLFSHAYWTSSKAGTSLAPKKMGKDLSDKLLSIQAASKAKIVLWHVGHVHRDNSQIIKSGNSSILVVSTSTDNLTQSDTWGGPKMTKGTATEQVIDYVQIDKKNKKVYMTRIGAGIDRVFNY